MCCFTLHDTLLQIDHSLPDQATPDRHQIKNKLFQIRKRHMSTLKWFSQQKQTPVLISGSRLRPDSVPPRPASSPCLPRDWASLTNDDIGGILHMCFKNVFLWNCCIWYWHSMLYLRQGFDFYCYNLLKVIIPPLTLVLSWDSHFVCKT